MKIFKAQQAYLAFMMLILSVFFIAGCGGGGSNGSDNPGRGSVLGALCSGGGCVDLGAAGDFVILAKTTITDANLSTITGNIGLSPGPGSAIIVTCPEMTGKIYTVDATYVGSGDVSCVMPGPGANKTFVDGAILNVGTAYGDAAGRAPGATNLYGGILEGQNFTPGVYKWTTSVTLGVIASGNVTLTGSSTDVWIFEIAGDLTVAGLGSVPAGNKIILAGGAQASNVFWQVGGGTGATLGTYSTFNGIILSAKDVIIQHGAVLNGRAFADAQVTLDANDINAP